MFSKLYFNPIFQKKIILKVVDKAHLIYCWGLVASGGSRNFRTVQDMGILRPSYGNPFGWFLATEKAPILLMSATCRPKAMDAIKFNIHLGNHNLKICRAELVRPEIRFIRITMKYPLKTAKDLDQFFGPANLVPDQDLPPTLIYSGTQNGTLETLRAVNLARGQTENSLNGLSTCARRFHAATGPDDKRDRCDHFVGRSFPIMCCTMALGLGQNWNIVRRVLVMGQMEPATVAQMVGRCGRDGRPGVGVLLVEENRSGVGSKNQVIDFGEVERMSDDERMDALAITPVCLRVAMAVDNM